MKAVPKELIHNHFPQTQPYEVHEVMIDLLDNAAKWLVSRNNTIVVVVQDKSLALGNAIVIIKTILFQFNTIVVQDKYILFRLGK